MLILVFWFAHIDRQDCGKLLCSLTKASLLSMFFPLDHISSVEKNNGTDSFDRIGSTYPNEVAAPYPMPQITDANLVFHEIYSNEKPTSEVMKWVYQ